MTSRLKTHCHFVVVFHFSLLFYPPKGQMGPVRVSSDMQAWPPICNVRVRGFADMFCLSVNISHSTRYPWSHFINDREVGICSSSVLTLSLVCTCLLVIGLILVISTALTVARLCMYAVLRPIMQSISNARRSRSLALCTSQSQNAVFLAFLGDSPSTCYSHITATDP